MSFDKIKTELLAPAGSYDAARAAANAGADAIYMGGPLFSARAYAESSAEKVRGNENGSIVNARSIENTGNTDGDMLLRTLDFCHLRGVKVYMTLNTLLKEREMRTLADYLKPYMEHGLDGVIVQDLGVMRLILEEYPGTELHVSTQAVVTGPEYAGLLMRLGAKRIVLARELGLEEIKRIYEETGAELEVFAHGALCYSYSGQCLMSSFIGGRSGNRGRCAGTCRLPYEVFDDRGRRMNGKNDRYVLSMKDLNTVIRLREMIDAGVYSFKIEGRMKSPEYVAAAVSVYRRYLDMAMETEICGNDIESDLRLLSEVFERGGHTDGYLSGINGPEMLTLKEKSEFRARDEGLIDEIREKYIKKDKKVRVSGRVKIISGELPEFELRVFSGNTMRDLNEAPALYGSRDRGIWPGAKVSISGEKPVSMAKNRPVTKEEAFERLSALGDTDFEMAEISGEVEEGIFIPVGELKAMRRKAVEMLKLKLLNEYVRHGDDEG